MDQDLKRPIVEKTLIDVIGNVDEKFVINKTWGWKLATSIDDAFAFMNGTSPYQSPVSAARICAMWKEKSSRILRVLQAQKSTQTNRWLGTGVNGWIEKQNRLIDKFT